MSDKTPPDPERVIQFLDDWFATTDDHAQRMERMAYELWSQESKQSKIVLSYALAYGVGLTLLVLRGGDQITAIAGWVRALTVALAWSGSLVFFYILLVDHRRHVSGAMAAFHSACDAIATRDKVRGYKSDFILGRTSESHSAEPSPKMQPPDLHLKLIERLYKIGFALLMLSMAMIGVPLFIGLWAS